MIGTVVWRSSTPAGIPLFIHTRDFVPITFYVPKERTAVEVYQSIINLIPGALIYLLCMLLVMCILSLCAFCPHSALISHI